MQLSLKKKLSRCKRHGNGAHRLLRCDRSRNPEEQGQRTEDFVATESLLSVIPENWAVVYELHFKIKKPEVTNKQEKETRCHLTGEQCGRKHFPQDSIQLAKARFNFDGERTGPQLSDGMTRPHLVVMAYSH